MTRSAHRRSWSLLRLEYLEDRTLLDGGGPVLLHHPEAILRPDFGAQAAAPPIQPVLLPPPGDSQSGGRLGPIPVNVLVNDPAEDGNSINDTHSETSLVLGSNNTIVAAFNDSFYANASPQQYTGYSMSSDGGMSFTDEGRLPHTGIPQGDLGDPSLARDNITGRIYLATLSFNGSILNIYHSDDNGATFSVPVNGDPGHSSASLDKEWLAVDNASGAGQGTVYLITRDFGGGNGIYLTRSTDQGLTFNTDWVQIASGGGGNVQGAWVTVGPDHTVYAFWYDATTPQQAIKMRKSTDQGHTFAPAVTVATLRTTGTNGDLSLGGFRSNAFAQAVVNPITNSIYVTFDDKGSGTDRADVFFTQSNDGGATWSPEVKVNDDTTTRDQWQPAIAVTPNGSKVGIFWYDRRNDSANNLIDRYGSVGSVAGNTVTFAPNMRISDTSFPPAFGHDPAINSVYMGDYDQVVGSTNAFYLTWGDNRSPSLGHTGNRQDVRFAKVTLAVAGASVISTIPTGNTFGAVSSVRVTFDEPMDPTSFTPDKVHSFTAPDGSTIPVTAVTPVAGSNDSQFDVSFAQQLTLGRYTMVLGPDILDTQGREMDQNGNGISGEVPDDAYTATFTLQGPQVTASTPNATSYYPGQVGSFRLTFNQPIDPSTFGPGAVRFSGPGGSLPVNSVTPVAGSNNTQFDISFATLGTTGVYTLVVGPHIQNFFGTEMDQNGNFIPGEDPDDAYTITFGVRGPRVTASSPVNTFDTFPVDHVRVTFDEPIDPSTFTPDKIASFTGPGGAIPVIDVVPVAGTNNTRFDIQFDPQAADGAYALVLGPNINDTFGNPMDQDGDFTPGEIPSDQYTAAFTIAATPAPLGPDAFGYTAAVTPSSDQDIVGKPGTFTIIAAGSNSYNEVSLRSNTFNFYGNTYTGPYRLWVSPYGLVTFGTPTSLSTNSDLTTTPNQATIAVLWNNWVKDFGDPTGPMVVGKFTAYDSNNVPHELVIEWNQVHHAGSFTGRLSFQMVLQLNTGTSPGEIGFNYLNLQSGDPYAEGAGSTVGIKAVGAQGGNRLLVNYPGTSPFVGSGQAILFATGTDLAAALVTARPEEPRAAVPTASAVAAPALAPLGPSALDAGAPEAVPALNDGPPLAPVATPPDPLAQAGGLEDPFRLVD